MKPQEVLDELQSLDPNNVGAWPAFVYVAACILVFVLITVGGYFYSVTPKLEQLARFEREEKTLRQDFENKQRKVASLDAYRAQLEEMQRSFGSMLRQLPSKTEVANLLNDISQTRVASGLEEQLFQPQGEQRKDFYAVLPNTIVVNGSYHEMADFVSRVSSLPRIVTISNVTIAAQKGTDDLQMNATVNTYRYLDESEGGS